ncbi:hypothetical protein [Lentibacillus sp. CBA3610]|uniref:hypothetical protein n=1 Tax=Lentibacillus sp. CBA3610 TaxID=2518176 RepID=UPI0020D2267C|nr:hypothetical protein [Lentibacillus sp. CBA3610]
MNLTYFLFFLCIIVCTLIITYWAAKQSKTTSQFYVAAGSLTGIQNGMAIAGITSVRLPLGDLSGTIAISGTTAFICDLAFGFLFDCIVFIAEPVHRLGKYSLG